MKDVIEEKVNDGIYKTKAEDVQNIMTKLSYTAEQAMDLLNIPVSDRESLLRML